MSLANQLELLLISFLYGIFVFITLEINAKLIYNLRKRYRYPITLLFSLVHSLMYFLILMLFNYGYIHIYGIFMTFFSFLTIDFFYHHYKEK